MVNNNMIPNFSVENKTTDSDMNDTLHRQGSLAFLHFYTSILAIIFIVGLLGNFLVIYVVGRFSAMQTVTNIHLMSLAIADTLYLLSMPFFLHTINSQAGFPTSHFFLCKFFWFLSTVNWFAGTFALTAMGADRYLAILHPFQAQSIRTPQNTTIIVVLLWILSVGLMVPSFINAQVDVLPLGNGLNHTRCTQSWYGQSDTPMIAFTMYTFAFGYLIPCLMIVGFYSMVIYRLRTVGPEKKSKEKRESQRKTTRLVLAVILVYVFCWMPYWINQLRFVPRWMNLRHQSTSNGTEMGFADAGANYIDLSMSYTSQLLGYLNSAVNPVLYSFMSQNFRKSFQHVFTCRLGETGLPPEASTTVVRRKGGPEKQKTALFSDDQTNAPTATTSRTVVLSPRDDVERSPLTAPTTTANEHQALEPWQEFSTNCLLKEQETAID